MTKLFAEIAPEFAGRSGGYTRMLKRHERRLGDAGPTAFIEFVKADEATERAASVAPKVATDRIVFRFWRAGGVSPLVSSLEETRGLTPPVRLFYCDRTEQNADKRLTSPHPRVPAPGHGRGGWHGYPAFRRGRSVCNSGRRAGRRPNIFARGSSASQRILCPAFKSEAGRGVDRPSGWPAGQAQVDRPGRARLPRTHAGCAERRSARHQSRAVLRRSAVPPSRSTEPPQSELSEPIGG